MFAMLSLQNISVYNKKCLTDDPDVQVFIIVIKDEVNFLHYKLNCITSMATSLASKYSKLAFLGACLHSGQPIKGVELAPAAIRHSGLFESLAQKYSVKVKDFGDIFETINHLHQKQGSACNVQNLHILDPSLKELNDALEKVVRQQEKGEVAVTVGGDHSIASATIHAVLGTHPDLKVIWVDAHADMVQPSHQNYPHYHGMPLSHIMGMCDGILPGFNWMGRKLNPQNVVHIGMRDIDKDQWEVISKSGIKVFTPDHIDDFGIGGVMRQAIEYLDPQGKSPFHISFDIDAVDPAFCDATGTKYRGGLTPREANFIVRKTASACNLVSMDLVEINPNFNEPTRTPYRGQELYSQISSTVGVGVDLIDSIFKSYLKL